MSATVRLARLAGLCLIFYAYVAESQSTNNKEVTVPAGRRAVLTCDTRGVTFAYETSWERQDGTFLTRSRQYVIENVRMSDAGVYVCRISNINDRSQVAMTQLQLRVVPADSGITGELVISTAGQASERLTIGGLIFRECKVNDPSGGTWKYQWTYPDGRVVVSSILYVPNLQVTHYGVYRCSATNPANPTRPLSVEFKFSPATKPAAGALQVKIRRISLRNPFVLECYVEGGSGGYTYEWRKGDVVVTRTQRLTVTQVEAATSGTYECIVSGTGVGGAAIQGRTSDEVRVVMKQSQAKISLAPPPGPIHIVELGKTKELHCELDQDRPVAEKAVWKFYSQGNTSMNAVPLTLTNENRRLFSNPSVSILVLNSIKKSDTGRYECEVERDGKIMRREAFILVVSDVGLEVYPQMLRFVEGSNRQNPEFHCQVDNLPGGASALKWTFIPKGSSSEQNLPANARPSQNQLVLSTSFLTVVNPTLANDGYYVCRAPGGFEGRGNLIVTKPRGRAADTSFRLVVKPGFTVKVEPGATARLLCLEFEKRVVPDWRVPPAVQGQVRLETQGRSRILLFERVTARQDGTKFTCSYNGQDPQEVTIRVNPGCQPGFRRCRDGQCIRSFLFCNGRNDCRDGSDEDRAVCAKCEPNEVECKANLGRSPIKKCIPVHWVCDGEDDCGNNFDEKSCTPGVGCSNTLFQCRDGRRIPRGFHCDGEADCGTNDDELGCIAPQITNPSRGNPQLLMKRVGSGTEVRLMCEAIGVSVPKIVWRYNWGFVTAQHRIDERCIDPNRDISTLIISRIQVRDAGIYTCEALNNQGRAFAEDYIVDVSAPRVLPPPPPPPFLRRRP